MKNLELIAMIGKNNELGCDDRLLWNINDDREVFKNVTLNKIPIMGMHTYKKQIRNPNTKDKSIVLTRKALIDPKVVIFNSKVEALHRVYKNPDKTFIVIGGEQVFNLFIDDVEIMYLLHINQEYLSANKYFPNVDYNLFDKELILEGKQDYIEYKEYKYIRK